MFPKLSQGGALDDSLTIEGYTAQRLVTEEQLHPVAAFATSSGSGATCTRLLR
jgi:hypothetical protein